MAKNFDVQSVVLDAPVDKAFSYIADPRNLPKWTKAFAQADEKGALMVTPNGHLQVDLKVIASKDAGTIDWHMTMPDGTSAAAYSRATPKGSGTVYSFVLMAPPVPIEHVEGTLHQQKELLREELGNLRKILE
jgi:hypothetical protein